MTKYFKYMIQGIVILFLIVNTLYSAAGWVRTSSNTLVFTEDFTTTEYFDDSSVDYHTISWGSGRVRPANATPFNWDPPYNDIVYDPKNGVLYGVGEERVYVNDYGSNPAGWYRSEPLLWKFDLWGNKLPWSNESNPKSVWCRNSTNIYYGNEDDKFPSITVDTEGNVYVMWHDRNSSGTRVARAQKYNSKGEPQWNGGVEVDLYTGIRYRGYPRGLWYNGYLYVVVADSTYTRLIKVNSTNGNVVNTWQVASAGTCYFPDIAKGPDGYLYIAWEKDFNTIYLRRFDPSTETFSSELQVNQNTGYGYRTYWYSTENRLAITVAPNTNVYIVWSLDRGSTGSASIWMQKVSNMSVVWANDKQVNDDSWGAYPSIASSPQGVFVSWISRDSIGFNHGKLRKLDFDGNDLWGFTIDLAANYSFYHGGRLTTYQNDCLTFGYWGSRYMRFNQDGNRYWSGIKQMRDNDRPYQTATRFKSHRILPGIVLKVRLYEDKIHLPEVSSNVIGDLRYCFSGNDGATWTPYMEITNRVTNTSEKFLRATNFGQGGWLEYTVTNVGNSFKWGALLNGNCFKGTNYVGLAQIRIEAIEYYLGDWLVSMYETGENAKGELVLNTTGVDQSIDVYVYNNGTLGAEGYFMLKNNGNIASNFRITGSPGNADWTMKYYLCTNNGSAWVTNKNITTDVINGFITNVQPYNSTNDIVCIKAVAIPSTNLAEGSTYDVQLQVEAQLVKGGTTNWYTHDVAIMYCHVQKNQPDLIAGATTNTAGEVIDYKGDGIYNADGTYQNQFKKSDTNVVAVYFIKLENDGTADTINIRGDGSSGNFNVKYFAEDGTDITSTFTQSTGMDISLGTTEYTQFRVEVTPLSGASTGEEFTNYVYAESKSVAGREDVIKFITRRVYSKADVLVKRDEDPSFIGDNIYNTNANNQSVTNIADNGMTNLFVFRIYNEGSEELDLYLSGSTTATEATGWFRRYYTSDFQDITTQILSNEYVVEDLPPGNYVDIYVKLAPPDTFGSYANQIKYATLLVRPEGAYNVSTKMDKAKINTKVITSKEDLIAITSSQTQGKGIVTNSYVSQSAFEYINHMITNTYTATISNTAPSPYKVKVTKNEINNTDWDIVYYHNGTNISTYLDTGWWTPEIAPYGKEDITIQIHPQKSVAVDITNAIILTGVSEINTNDIDTIRFLTCRIYPPDLMVRKTNQDWRGTNVYGTNLAAQELAGSISTNIIIQGNTNDYIYLALVENERTVPINVKLWGTGSDTNFWVRYWIYQGTNKNDPEVTDFSKWSNITSYITNQTGYTLYNLAGKSNELFMITVRVTNTNVNEGNAIETRLYGWELDAGYVDMIKMYTTYGVARPDLVVTATWNNVYETNVVIQKITNIVDKAVPYTNVITIQNESSVGRGSFLFSGPPGAGDINVRYYIQSTGEDITGDVTSPGKKDITLLPNTSTNILMVISVVTDSLYTNGYTATLWARIEPDIAPELRDVGNFITILTDKGRPDLSLSNAWTNVYETNFATQNYTTYIEKGHTNEIIFYIGNDRPDGIAEVIRFNGDIPSMGSDFTVNYFIWENSSWSNVTSVAGGLNKWLKRVLPANTVKTMKMQISLSASSSLDPGDFQDFVLRTKSQGQQVKDYGRIRAQVVDLGEPNISFTNGVWTNYIESSPVNQVTNLYVEKGYTNEIYLYLWNDKFENETLKLTGSKGKGDFSVEYFIITNAVETNVTSFVTNGGFNINIASGSNVLAKVKVSLAKNSDYTFSSNIDIILNLYSQAGYVQDSVSLVVWVTDRGRPDLRITDGNFDDIYYPTLQQTNIYVEEGFTKYVYIELNNDNNTRSETFGYIATSVPSPWDQTIMKKDPILGYVPFNYTNLTYMSNIPPNSSSTLWLRLTLDEDADLPDGSQQVTSMTLISEGKLVKDAMRFVYTVTDMGRPDLLLANSFGSNVYEETTPATQIYTNYIEKGETINTIFYIGNDNTNTNRFMLVGVNELKGENLKFTGDGPYGDFSVKYYRWTNGSWIDVTSSAVAGYKVFVPTASCVTMMMETTLADPTAYPTNYIASFDWNLISQGEEHQDNFIIRFKVVDKGKPDIAFTNGVWSNIIESSPITQITNMYIEKGYTNTIYLYFWNHRTNRSETFKFERFENESGTYDDFSTAFYSNGTKLLSSGDSNVYVNTNTNVLMVMKLSLDLNSSYQSGDSVTNLLYLWSEKGFVNDAVKIITFVTDYGRPDLYVEGGKFDDVYYTNTQLSNILIEKGFKYTNIFYLNNDLTSIRSKERYRVYGTAGNSDWTVTYYIYTNGSFSNVTADVTSTGRYVYVNANSIRTMQVVVEADANNPSLTYGDSYNVNIDLFSQGELVKDRISFVYTITDLGRPDIFFTNNKGTNYYESATVTYQVITNDIEKGETNWTVFLCQNDNSTRGENLRFKGDTGDADYTLYYFYKTASGWSNVTADATSTIGFSFYVPSLTIRTMKVGAYLKPDSTLYTNVYRDFTYQLLSQGQLVVDKARVFYRTVDLGKPNLYFTNNAWRSIYEYVPYDTYPVTSQISNFYVEKGYTNSIYIMLGNDKSEPETLHFYSLAPTNTNEFTIHYFTNSIDITTNVVSSNGLDVSVPASSNRILRIDVALDKNSDNTLTNKIYIDILLKSEAKFHIEKARLVVWVTDYGRPDLYTDNGDFDDIYYDPFFPNQQIKNIPAEKGFTITNYIYLGNDLNAIRPEEKYFFKAQKASGEWMHSYIYFTNGSWTDVSSEVTNGRYFTVPQNSSVTLASVMSLNTNSTLNWDETFTTTMTLISEGQLQQDIMSFVYKVTDAGIPDIALTNTSGPYATWSSTYEISNAILVQIKTNEIELKKTNHFFFYIENDNTNRGETLTFKAEGSKLDYVVDYYRISGTTTNLVTSQVTDNYVVYLPNNSRITMEMRVVILSNAGTTTNQLTPFKWYLLSQGKGKQDSALIYYKLVDNGKPNIVLTNGEWTNRESEPVTQITNFYIEPRRTNLFMLRIQNDKNHPEILHLKATPGVSPFILNYVYISNAVQQDVTSQITNTYGMNIPLDANTTNFLKILAIVDTNSTYSIGTNMNIFIELYSEARFVKDKAKLIAIITDFGRPDLYLPTGQYSNVFYPVPQSTTRYIEKGFKYTNFIKAFNALDWRDETFLVYSTNEGNTNYIRTFYYISNGSYIDITTSVTSTGREITIPSLTSITLAVEMELSVQSYYTSQCMFTLPVELYSAARLVKDRLSLVYGITDLGNPDIYWTNAKWSNVQEWNEPEKQNIYVPLEKGESTNYVFYIKNARTNFTERMAIWIPSFETYGWSIKVELFSNSSFMDITTESTSSGYHLYIPANSVRTMRLTIGILTNNTNSIGFTNSFNVRLYSQTKLKYDEISVKAIVSSPHPDIIIYNRTYPGPPVSDGIYSDSVDFSLTEVSNISYGRAYYGFPNTFSIVLRNNDAITDVIYIQTILTNIIPLKWKYSIYTIEGGTTNNVTTKLAGGNTKYKLAGGESKTFTLKVEMYSMDVDIDEPFNMIIKAVSSNNLSRVDVVGVVVRRQPVNVTNLRVYKANSEIPISGATVIIGEGSTSITNITDNNGKISFESLPGTYKIRIIKEGYIPYEGEVSIKDAPTYDAGNFYIIPYNLNPDETSIHIFPNPVDAGDTSTIVYSVKKDSVVSVEIYDILGRLIYTVVDEQKLSKGLYNFTWNGTDSAGKKVRRGLYFVVIKTDDEVVRYKIFVK